MDKDFAYGLRGFTMAIIFLAAIKFISSAYTLYFPGKTSSIDSIAKHPPSFFFVINERGKKLFSDNCSSCHSVSKNIDGLTLENVEERVTSCEVLYEYIRNSQKVIESGDPYFVEQYNRFNQTSMPSFPNLSDKDVDDILEYIDQSYAIKNDRSSPAAN